MNPPVSTKSCGRSSLVSTAPTSSRLARLTPANRTPTCGSRSSVIPDFAKRVRSIVVEFGSTTEQATLDRYIRGEAVTPAQLAEVWKTTTQPGIREGGSSRFYVEFFNAVRNINAKLPADMRIRVFGGDPGRQTAVAVRLPPSRC